MILRRRGRVLVGIASVVLVICIALWPVTTRFGIDYRVSERKITLFEKCVSFVDRDLQTRRLTKEITRGTSGDEEILLKLFSYVQEHVRPTPPGLPVIDDHPLYILVRGYGAPDQQTEAFALLASYSGYPATAAFLPAGGDARFLVALVQMGDRVLVFGVADGVLFRDAQGRLIDLAELRRDPARASAAAPGHTVGGLPLERFFQQAEGAQHSFIRMESQKPLTRLKFELLRLVGR